MYKLPKKTISLYVFPLPILLLLLVAAGLGSLALNNSYKNNSPAVLSSDDDNSGGGSGGSGSSGGDSNKDSNKQAEESAKKASEAAKESQKKAEEVAKKSSEQQREMQKKTLELQKASNSGSSNLRTTQPIKFEDDEKNIDANGSVFKHFEDENELDKAEGQALVSEVTNPDGTVTRTFKKMDGNEVKTKILTLDANGNIIGQQELKQDGTEDESETKLTQTITNPDGTVTKIFTKTDGTEVEIKSLTYDANGVLISKAELNPDGTVKEEERVGDKKPKESTETENENEQENDNNFKLTFTPTAGETIDPTLGKIIKAQLKQEIENEAGLGTGVNKVELKIKTDQGTIKYEGTASKAEKLFGIFGVEVPVDLVVDPVTGQITSVNQSFWSKVLDFFSF